jgi:hypothetical protein
VSELNSPTLEGAVFRGILEFDGPTRFRLLGVPGRPGGEAERPQTFTSGAVVFSRAG